MKLYKNISYILLLTLLLSLLFLSFCVTAQQQQQQNTENDPDSFWDQVLQEDDDEERNFVETHEKSSMESPLEDNELEEGSDEFTEFFDSEINDYNSDKSQKQETQKHSSPSTQIFKWPQKDDWTLEIGFLTIIFIFGVNYFYGRSQNQNIARKWVNTHGKLFRKHFNKFSLSPSQHNDRMVVARESPFEFTLYGQGNPFCVGFIASLRLKRRQDLFSYPLNIIYPTSDELILYVPMKKMDTFVFAVTKESDADEFKKNHSDLNTFGNISKHKAQNIISAGLSCITDAPEINENETMQQFFDAIAASPNIFVSLHVSDRSPYAENIKNKQLIRLHMKLPSKANEESSMIIISAFLKLMGFIANYQLPSFVRRRISIRRNAVEEKLRKEERERQKELQEQKSHEIKKNRDKQIKSLSREQQARAEKKKRKKEEKKMMGKSKIVKG